MAIQATEGATLTIFATNLDTVTRSVVIDFIREILAEN
jgi:hypothetical protein